MISRYSSYQLANLVVLFAGGLSAALGLAVLAGSQIQAVAELAAPSTFRVMSNGSGLAFLVCGIAMLAIGVGRARWALPGAVIAISLGMINLVQHHFEINLGVHQLMAPNSAFCFVLAGTALLGMSRHPFEYRPVMVGLLGSVLSAVGVIAIFGYVVGVETYDWGKLVPMSFYAAGGFAVLGVGLLGVALRDGRNEETITPVWFPVPVCAGGVTATLCLWQALVAHNRAEIERNVESEATRVKNAISVQLDNRISTLERMGKRLELWGQDRQAEWKADVRFYIQSYPSYQAVEWVDRSFQTRALVPREGVRSDRIIDPRYEDRRRDALASARHHGEARVSRPVRLANGEWGLVMCIPTKGEAHLDGFLVGVFQIQKLLDSTLHNNVANGFSIGIFVGADQIYDRAEPTRENEDRWSRSKEIDFHEAHWRVLVWPTADWLAELQTSMPILVLVVGLLMTGLLTGMVHLAYTSNRRRHEVEVAYQGLEQEIAERKRVEEHVRALNAELEQRVEKRTAELKRSNAELEQFAYVAAHDLQEPLRKVVSYTQLLAEVEAGKLDPEADEFIAYAVDGAKRMQTLIQDLLDYSRIGRKGNGVTSVDGEAALQTALINLQGALDESGAVVTHDPLPRVMAEEGELVRLFQNIIGNAIKFRKPEPPCIHVRGDARGRQWMFSIRDNGIGIDPQYQERIFAIFQRLHTRAEYPGTGIGLAICKKIVERHGGRIWMESERGQGSVFYFTLPAETATRPEGQAHERSHQVQGNGDSVGGRRPGGRAPDARGAEAEQGIHAPERGR
jgi:signal transduction histidine kinase